MESKDVFFGFIVGLLVILASAYFYAGSRIKTPQQCTEWHYKNGYDIIYPDGTTGKTYVQDYCSKYEN